MKNRKKVLITTLIMCFALLFSAGISDAQAADEQSFNPQEVTEFLQNANPVVSDLQATAFNQKVRLTWNEVSLSSGYDAVKMDAEENVLKHALVSKNNINFTNLENDQTYKFKVRAYYQLDSDIPANLIEEWLKAYIPSEYEYEIEKLDNNEGYRIYAPYSETIAAVPYNDIVTGLKATPYAGKIKLSWQAVEGVDGYYIYAMYSDDSKYKTYSTTKASCNFTNLINGDTYKFKVKTYKYDPQGTKVYSTAYSSVVKAVPQLDEVKKLEALEFNKKIRIDWEAVDGTESYFIDVTYKDGTRYKSYSTSKTYCNFTNLVNNEEYTFDVKAKYTNSYGKTCYGKSGASVTAAPYNDTVVDLKAIPYDSKIKLSWSSVEDADGYYIYAMYSDGSKYKTYSTTKTTCNFTKLINGKTYKFKVRAYKIDQTGTKVYSTYSKIVKAAPAK